MALTKIEVAEILAAYDEKIAGLTEPELEILAYLEEGDELAAEFKPCMCEACRRLERKV